LSSNTRADAEYALPVDVQTEARRPAVWYHANMSVFRSLPDVWAIQQLFPVAPLHRLRERPRAAGAVADLTCDSDGRIDAFVGALSEELGGGADAERGAPSPFLALHAPNAGEPYLMAAFLVGAYQESMGSAGHNLFGSPATANVFLDRPEPFDTLPNPEAGEAGEGNASAREALVSVRVAGALRRRGRRRLPARGGHKRGGAARRRRRPRQHRGVGARRRRRAHRRWGRRRRAPRRRRRCPAREHVLGIARFRVTPE
jgi:hypothetical protein